MNKKEYKEELKKIEERNMHGKKVQGLSVLNLEVLQDNDGQAYLVGYTGKGILPVINIPVEIGEPVRIVEDRANRVEDRRAQEKAALEDKIRNEELQVAIAARNKEIEAAASQKHSEIVAEEEVNVAKKLKKLFGGK